MSSHHPVSVAVVGQDAATAAARRPVVVQALRGASGHGEAQFAAVAVEQGRDGALAWLRSDLADRPETRRLAVFPGANADAALELLQAGVNGVIADHVPGWVLRHAMAVVRRGGTFLDPWLAHDIADHARPRGANLAGVTGAEQRVLSLITDGLGVHEIAAELSISSETVKGHLHNLQERLGVSRREMVRTARALGLLPGGGNRAKASSWDSVRGLHGISVFVLSRERLAGETLAGALRGAGARVVGCGDSSSALSASNDQWAVTVALVQDSSVDLLAMRNARPRSALVVVPWRMDGRVVRGALGARAQGVVGVGAGLDELVAAIRVAAAAGLYLDTAALNVTVGSIDYRPRQPSGPLTVRQLEVLSLVDRGYSNRRIGDELGLAEPTVKGHLRRTLKLLGASDRRQAVLSARRLGLLDAV